MHGNETNQVEGGCCAKWSSKGDNIMMSPTNVSAFDDNDERVEFESRLIKEMNELSIQERQKVLEEIHGVAEVQEETPEIIEKALDQFDEAVENLGRGTRRSLDRAIFLRPSLQEDSKFKLMFLRTEYFDAVKAAIRMAKFFDNKLELFGPERLAKDITLEDLDEHEKKVLMMGHFCRLPSLDAAGRPIMLIDPSRFNLENQESMCRVNWYITMSSFTDEASQRKGIVNLVFLPENFFARSSYSASSFAAHLRRVAKWLPGMPSLVTSYQTCYQDARLGTMLSTILRNFGRQIRLHTRTHIGSSLEIQYALMTFGINCKGVPQIEQNETQVTAMMEEYVANRTEIEQEEAENRKREEARSGFVQYPQPCDVLIGRGRPYHEFSGTQRLLLLIAAESQRYIQIDDDRFQKMCISMEVVKKVREYNGRFLQRTEKGWIVLDDEASRKKVINLLRYNKQTGLASISGNSSLSAGSRAKRPKLG